MQCFHSNQSKRTANAKKCEFNCSEIVAQRKLPLKNLFKNLICKLRCKSVLQLGLTDIGNILFVLLEGLRGLKLSVEIL